MSKIIFTACLVLFVPVFVFAQTEEADTESQILKVGEQEIIYGEMIAIDNGALYYDKNTDEAGAIMVASSHDTNGDDTVDVWFVYDANQNVTTEAYDQDGDQTPDVFLATDENSVVTSISGEGTDTYTREVATRFNPEPISGVNQGEDLVGDISDITLEEKDDNWIFFVILLIVGVGLYFFWKRQK